VEGLCGNFNGNMLDDFKGPSGGPAIVRVTEFADSWKLHDYCAGTIDVGLLTYLAVCKVITSML
jgi:hypothetical protein